MDNSDQWGSTKPNLSKLPAHVRENLTKPIDLRSGEFYSKIVIYQRTPGLQHPNGRVFVQTHLKDADMSSTEVDGLQIDFLDFSGRHPLVTVVIPKDKLEVFRQKMDSILPPQDHPSGIPTLAVPLPKDEP